MDHSQEYSRREVRSGHKTERETGHSNDLGSFLMSQVTTGNEIEYEAGMRTKKTAIQPISFSIWWPAVT